MRRLSFVVAALAGGVLWLGFAGAPAFADNGPHYSSAGNTSVDRCAACHRAHTAKGEYLLKQAQPALCYTCHGAAAGGASTDVYDGIGYTGWDRGGTAAGGQALRGGGFAYALIDSGHADRNASPRSVPTLTAGQATTSAHTVDGTPGIAWGNGAVSATASAGATINLTCGSCHDPHGNGNYRILRPIPNDSGASTGVVIADSPVKVYTTTNYWLADDPNSPWSGNTVSSVDHYTGKTITYNPTSFLWNISAWCTQCHTRYMAPSGSYDTKLQVPDPANPGQMITDTTYTYRHRSDQNYKAPGANCITCHVAHGTDAQMSGSNSGQVTNPDGSEPAGSSKLLRVDNRGTCNMCHNV